MPALTSNRALLVVLLVGLGTAIYTIPRLLRRVKDEAKAPQPEPPPAPKRLQKDSENSLKIETLRTLADGYSHELRTSAIKIVASRTARSSTKSLLLRDLASKDYGRRDNAINGLWMLLYHPSLNGNNNGGGKVMTEFHDAETATATVHALINVLPLHNINDHQPEAEAEPSAVPNQRKKHLVVPPSPVRPAHRPAHEVSLLIILNNILSYSARRMARPISGNEAMEAALDAGLVTRWLANYPFPCALAEKENLGFNFKKSDVARLFDRMAWLTDDLLMADIVLEVMQCPRGRKEMRAVGLSTSRYRENDLGRRGGSYRSASNWDLPGWVTAAQQDEEQNNRTGDDDVRMVGGEDTAGVIVEGNEGGPQYEPMSQEGDGGGGGLRPRSMERSQEEEHLRRRHREAIVVADPGAPLRRENILQRANSQQILQPMNGTSEVEGVLNGLLGLSGASGNHHVQEHQDQHASHVSGVPERQRQDDSRSRVASELDRVLDVQDIEHMLDQSLSSGGPSDSMRDVIHLLQSDEPVILVPTASSRRPHGGASSDSDSENSS
ncbi:hypothetical protein KCU88_g5822, partial [Aureobasidium melanogenum]